MSLFSVILDMLKLLTNNLSLFILCELTNGWMAERSKAAVLKTVVAQVTGGSNPSPSVFFIWSGGRAAEGASLLRRYTGNGIPGSNPGHSVFDEIVAQLDRASDCGSEGQKFESSRSHKIIPTAIRICGRNFFIPDSSF